MSNHTSNDQKANEYWRRNDQHGPDEVTGYSSKHMQQSRTATNGYRHSSTQQRNRNQTSYSNRSNHRGPSMADQVDNWRSRSNDTAQKDATRQNEIPNYPQEKMDAYPDNSVYYSTTHTNGTTYYYSKNQLVQMHQQQQQQPNHFMNDNSNLIPKINNEHSNTDNTLSPSTGANAQWRNHQIPPPQQQQKTKPEIKPPITTTLDIPEKVMPQNENNNTPKKTLVHTRQKNTDHHQPSKKRQYYHPDDRPSQTRESLYEPFLNPRDMETGLQNGTLHEGILKVGRTRLDCYVVTDELDHDIYIGGNRDRNRAFHGDRVVVRLKDVEAGWKLKKERKERWLQKRKLQKKEELKKLKEETDLEGDEEEEEEEEEDESDDDSSYDEEQNKPKYCGEVVGIKYRLPGLSFSGTMSVFRDGSNAIDPNNTKVKIAWFRPLDKKVPLLVIPPKLVPADMLENPSYYSSNCFIAEFKDWRIFEQSPNIGSYKLIGPKGAFETEKKCIIQDNDITVNEFSRMAMNSLPSTPWIIPLQEYVKRRDLRTKRIFTIDPRTAKDLDDAVHIEYIEEDVYEVGVHIADVTHFLKRNTPLDTEARERGTSTYFVDGVIPMLPALLSEELCSLNSGVERLAFSVIWKMNKKGDVLNTWFGKTVIRSCAKLAYEDAQDVIDGKRLSNTIEIFNDQDSESIESDILLLLEISKKLREKRYQGGALSLNSVKLNFKLDDTGIPIDVSVVELKEANRLIEEFMLLANISVAHKVLQKFPDEALLRRHEDPNERRLEDFRLLTEKLGLDFDISTAGSLQKSFENIPNDDLKAILQVIATRPMKRAKYFCTGSLDVTKYSHYALNEPMYTHFTSPIRRYADVVIHRVLQAALDEKEMSVYAKKRLQEIANDCNRKRDSARNAQDQNNLLYLGIYLNNLEVKQGPIHSRAIVVSVRKRGFDIYLPEYGLEKSIGLDRLPIENSMFDKNRYILAIFWKKGIPVTMHNEEKIYAQNKRPNVEEQESDEEDGIEKELSELALDGGDIQFPVKAFFNNETCMQEIRMFSPLDVRIQVNMNISPPYINAYPINHFADIKDTETQGGEEKDEANE